MKKGALLFLCLALAGACKTGGDLEPIVIDLSKVTRVPPSTPTPTPARASAAKKVTPEPAQTPPPAPAATPLPVMQPTVSSPSASPTGLTAAPTPEEVVLAQLTAFNRRDLAGFLSWYSADAVLYDHPDRVRQSGIEDIGKAYGQVFATSPELKAVVSGRIVEGDFVVDHETVSGLPRAGPMSAIAIYQVRDGKIRKVWFLR